MTVLLVCFVCVAVCGVTSAVMLARAVTRARLGVPLLALALAAGCGPMLTTVTSFTDMPFFFRNQARPK